MNEILRSMEEMKNNFDKVKVGDIIICYDQYLHDYDEHVFKVDSIEYEDEENGGKKCYGQDLTCGDDEEMYIGMVNLENFVRFA